MTYRYLVAKCLWIANTSSFVPIHNFICMASIANSPDGLHHHFQVTIFCFLIFECYDLILLLPCHGIN